MKFRKRLLPPAAELLAEAHRIFSYDAEIGQLRWREHTNRAHPGQAKIGSIVGGDDGHGYRMCAVLGHKFKVHQIIWLLHNGTLPALLIDHRNCDRRDNRIENLRLADYHQNRANAAHMRAPHAGASKQSKGRRFHAKIGVGGVVHHLGNFDTKEEANAAYVDASRRLRGEFSPV